MTVGTHKNMLIVKNMFYMFMTRPQGYETFLMLNSAEHVINPAHKCYQRTNGPVNAHLISWPRKAQNIQNLEKYMVKKRP